MRGRAISYGIWLLTLVATGCGDRGNAPLASIVGPSTSVTTPALTTLSSRCVLPPHPADVRVSVEGTDVRLSWSAVGAATDYVVAIGASPGGSQTLLRNTTQTGFQWPDAPAGTYYARVYAHSRCGTGDASSEVTITVDL